MRIFVYPWDLADEGTESTLAMFRGWGVRSLAVAVNYHTAKLFLPHNPRRKVMFPEPGRFYFPVERERFRHSVIQPEVSDWSKANPSFWEELAEAAARHRIELTAWTIGLHGTATGYRYPQFVVRNAFGDPYSFCLCPSNAEVRRYLARVAEALSDFSGFRELFLESFHFMEGIAPVVEAFDPVIARNRLRLALRAGYPDTASPRELVARLDAARRTGISGISLYNYGQVPMPYWRALESGAPFYEKEAKQDE